MVDGKIAGFGEMRSAPIPNGCEIIDGKGTYGGHKINASTVTLNDQVR